MDEKNIFLGYLLSFLVCSFLHKEIRTWWNGMKWAIPDKLCPNGGCQCHVYAESLEFHMLFYRFYLEIKTEKAKMSGFLGTCVNFFLGTVQTRIFVKKKTWKSKKLYFFQKKVWKSNLLWGRTIFFWNSPIYLERQH